MTLTPNHPKGDHSPSFSANAERGIFQCFRCKARGNVLDFAGLMEGIDLRNGAELRRVAQKLLGILPQAEERTPAPPKQPVSQSASVEKRVLVNEPLDFELKGLDTRHPWLLKSGLSPETIAHFGLGVAQRGYLKGRLAIPLHNQEGKLVGYAGRILDDSAISPENPKYLFPETRERNGMIHRFDPTVILYNAHRVTGCMDSLVIADGLENAWRAYEESSERVVALVAGADNSESLKRALRGIAKGETVRYYGVVPPPEFLWKAVGFENSILWIHAGGVDDEHAR